MPVEALSEKFANGITAFFSGFTVVDLWLVRQWPYFFLNFFNTFIGIIIIPLKKCFSLCAEEKREKGKDNKEIVLKWYMQEISREIYDKLLFKSLCSVRRPDYFRQRIKDSDSGWI